MPTIAEMYADLESADASGDYELAKVIASKIKQSQQPTRTTPAPMTQTPAQAALQGAGRGIASLAGGAIRGAGSIGATMVAPGDMIADYMLG